MEQDIILNANTPIDQIIKAIEENFGSYSNSIPPDANHILLDHDKLLILNKGIITRMGLVEDENQAKNTILTIIQQLRRPLLWCFGPHASPPQLAQWLGECGCELDNIEHGMYIPLSQFNSIPKSAAIEIKKVDNQETLRQFTDVLCEYWDPSHSIKSEIYLAHADMILNPNYPVHLFVAYLEASPASVCELYCHDGIAGIYSVTTAKKMRQRGIASQLLNSTLQFAHQQGMEIASVQSTAMAKSMYQSIGFIEIATFHKYRSSFLG